MAVLDTSRLTLLDLAKRTSPDGSVDTITEILTQQNEVLDDMVFMQGNLETGHRTTIRTGLPTPTWRTFNVGVQPAKSTTAQVTFSTAMLEQISEIDEDLANLGGNPAAVRLSEDRAAIEGINQELTRAIFYGNEDLNPEEFTGISYYYNDLTTAESKDNIVNGDAGGTATDFGSIWLIGWSTETITGLIPKNGRAGLEMKDKGVVDRVDAQGRVLHVYRTQFKLQAGLAVKDWRFAVRIANIRRGELRADISGNSADLPDLMFQAMERMQSLQGVRPVFYMDRTMRTFLRQQLAFKVASSTLTFEDVGGRRTMFFQEVPVRRVDALAVTEAQVS